jgi:hypothetical protein
MFEKSFQLIFENPVEMNRLFIFGVKVAELLHTVDDKLQLLQDLFKDHNVLVVNRFMQEVVQTKSTCYY